MGEAIQDFDFFVQEYPIDMALYTAEVEQEFKNAFWEAIFNQVPMVYRSDGAVYFRDWLGVVGKSDEEFFAELREAEYRFADIDGDGLPELAVQWEQEFCILSYNMYEKKVHLISHKEVSRNSAWEGFVSFAEAFGDMPDKQPVSAADVQEAQKAYEEFLADERSVGSESMDYLITPTGEPDKRYQAGYCIWDVDGDGIPELHILSGRKYQIYSYENGEIVQFQAFFSNPRQYILLENGAFLHLDYKGYENGGVCCYYFELNENGEEVNGIEGKYFAGRHEKRSFAI